MKKTFLAFMAVFFFAAAAFSQQTETQAVGKPKAGDTIVIEDSYFENETSIKLTTPSKAYLAKLAAAINKTKYASVAAEGYSYDSKTEDENIQFSKDRAKAVAFELMRSGIPNNKITFRGMGSKTLIANNDTKEGKTKNRRVEIKIK